MGIFFFFELRKYQNFGGGSEYFGFCHLSFCLPSDTRFDQLPVPGSLFFFNSAMGVTAKDTNHSL
jgi:hypothetical protein